MKNIRFILIKHLYLKGKNKDNRKYSRTYLKNNYILSEYFLWYKFGVQYFSLNIFKWYVLFAKYNIPLI